MRKIRKITSLIALAAMVFVSVPTDVLAAQSPAVVDEFIEDENAIEVLENEEAETLSNYEEAETHSENEGIEEGEVLSEDEELLFDTSEEVLEEVLETEETQKKDSAEEFGPESVYTIVDTIEEAEEIADFYGITLESYGCFVATYLLPKGISAEEIVQKSVDNENGYPQLFVNHYGTVSEMVYEEQTYDENYDDDYDDSQEDDMELSSYITDTYSGEYSDIDSLKENHVGGRGGSFSADESDYPWYHEVIGSPYAWTRGVNFSGEDKTIRGKGIKVAILSSGVNEASSWSSNEFTSKTGIITGKMKYYSVGDNSIDKEKCSDSIGNGTIIAETIGAEMNGRGKIGVAPSCSLFNVKITQGTTNVLTEADLIKGINYVNDNYDADVMIIDACFSAPLTASISAYKFGEDVTYYISDVINEAYEKGTIIFAPAMSGNESWPASYSHVVSVGASNKLNQRFDCYEYTKSVDIVAPGEAIRFYNFNAVSGTLPAAAIAAGEAALILSAQSEIKALQDANGNPLTGPARVDALLKHMKANTISAGKGCGSGIVYLPKALNIATLSDKITAPKIIEDTGLYLLGGDYELHYRFKLSSDYYGVNGFYYTVNGKKPSYQNGISDKYSTFINHAGVIDTVVDPNQKNLVIKAIAVDTNRGLASAVTTKTVPLKTLMRIKKVTTSDGRQDTAKLVRGKSLQCSVQLVPNNSYTKGVTWHIGLLEEIAGRPVANEQLAKDNKVKISSSGKVTADKKSTGEGIFRVWAVSKKDNSIVSEPINIAVQSEFNIKSLKVAENKKVLQLKYEPPSTTVEKLLNTVFVNNTDQLASNAPYTADDFVVLSSNPKIFSVEKNGGVWKGKTHAPGKVTITVKDAYGKGVKTSYTIEVIRLAESIKIIDPGYVARGKAAAIETKIVPSNASVKNIKWKIINGITDSEVTDGSIKVYNGKIITTKKAETGYYKLSAELLCADGRTTVSSLDSSGNGGYYSIFVTSGVAKVSLTKENKSCTIFSRNNTFKNDLTKKIVSIQLNNAPYEGSCPDMTNFSVTSSNEKIVSIDEVTVDNYGPGNGHLLVTVASNGIAGTATITVKSLDGGNSKASFKVKVVNPVSAVRIAPSKAGASMAVMQGKSLKLKAVISQEYGNVSNKKVTWSIPNEIHRKYASINSKTGELKAIKEPMDFGDEPYREILVKATAADGSGACTGCVVRIYNNCGNIEMCDDRGITVGSDGKKIKSSGTININSDDKIEFFVRIKNPYKYSRQSGWDYMTAKSSNSSLINIGLEKYTGAGWSGDYSWNCWLNQPNNDYVVYHFVARVENPSVLKKKSETVKLTITTLDGSHNLTYNLKVNK